MQTNPMTTACTDSVLHTAERHPKSLRNSRHSTIRHLEVMLVVDAKGSEAPRVESSLPRQCSRSPAWIQRNSEDPTSMQALKYAREA